MFRILYVYIVGFYIFFMFFYAFDTIVCKYYFLLRIVTMEFGGCCMWDRPCLLLSTHLAEIIKGKHSYWDPPFLLPNDEVVTILSARARFWYLFYTFFYFTTLLFTVFYCYSIATLFVVLGLVDLYSCLRVWEALLAMGSVAASGVWSWLCQERCL